jgi:hypothetical protein
MPQLNFKMIGCEVLGHAATPTIAFKLQIDNADSGQSIHSIVLRCQIQIETIRRRYVPAEQDRLSELYGEPQRWAQTLRSMLWTQVHSNIAGFVGQTVTDLPLPCSFDFNVAATKYLASLEGGEVPLLFLFSGTVFYEERDRGLQVEQIPWDRESNFRLPIAVWREMMSRYYPNERWLSLRADIFDRIAEYKRKRQISTWDQTWESLLSSAEQVDDAAMFVGKAS